MNEAVAWTSLEHILTDVIEQAPNNKYVLLTHSVNDVRNPVVTL